MSFLRNGVFGEHTRSAATVAKSHHRRINVQINTFFGLEVAVVGNGRELLFGIRQGGKREEFAVGRRNNISPTLRCCQRKRCRLLVVAAELRTRIMHVLLRHIACPPAYRGCFQPVHVAILQALSIPRQVRHTFIHNERVAYTWQRRQLSFGSVDGVEVHRSLRIHRVFVVGYNLARSVHTPR